MDHELIVTATVDNISQIELSQEDYHLWKPDSFYNFQIEKIFKWDQKIKTFTIAEESFSSCSSSYRSWTTYLLYLNPSKANVNQYYSYRSKARDYGENIRPEFNPLREKKRYTTYYNIKKELFNIQRDIRIFLENKIYYLQWKIDYYKVKYGFY